MNGARARHRSATSSSCVLSRARRCVRQEGRTAAAAAAHSGRADCRSRRSRASTDDVYVQFTVPTANIDGVGPGGRRARRGLTRSPPIAAPPVSSAETSTTCASVDCSSSEVVRKPLPPPPPPKEGMPPLACRRRGRASIRAPSWCSRDADAGHAHAPWRCPRRRRRRGARSSRPQIDVPRPLVAPAEPTGPQRYYYAVGGQRPRPLRAADRGRPGAARADQRRRRRDRTIAVDETAMTFEWTPRRGRARRDATPPTGRRCCRRGRSSRPAADDLRRLRSAGANADADNAAVRTCRRRSTPAPRRRHWRASRSRTSRWAPSAASSCGPSTSSPACTCAGPPRRSACASFADTFAPSPPASLWRGGQRRRDQPDLGSRATAKDLAGYLVLRGEAPAVPH